MADTMENLETNELDELQKKFAKQKIQSNKSAGKKESAEISDENEPNASNGTAPESRPKGPVMTADGRRLMFVAAKSKVKSVAAVIARSLREDEKEPVISAVGAGSVNQAIKAIAVARDFVKTDNLEISVSVKREPQEEVKDVFLFTIHKHSKGTLAGDVTDESQEDVVTMRSASNSTPKSFAGAIAANLRDGKKPVITAIGQVPVFKAVYSIALANVYLSKDGMSLKMYSKFTTVTFENGTEANAMKFVVLPGEKQLPITDNEDSSE